MNTCPCVCALVILCWYVVFSIIVICLNTYFVVVFLCFWDYLKFYSFIYYTEVCFQAKFLFKVNKVLFNLIWHNMKTIKYQSLFFYSLTFSGTPRPWHFNGDLQSKAQKSKRVCVCVRVFVCECVCVCARACVNACPLVWLHMLCSD